ncbi:MAG: bifunctional N-acetylglucosamine-1-phosphate uridyltransferase/glucosamine-1-phosphate acetyltransferase, partial [Hyphomicrobiales bacterium]
MTTAAYLSIILAAGQGTRMNSRHPKVMHKIAGLPMIGHVLGAVEKAKCNRVAVVVGPDMDELSSYVKSCNESAGIHLQEERLGTGHAVLAARKDLANNPDKVVVLYGDTPFVKPSTITAMLDVLDEGADVVVLGFEPETPGRYGRLVLKNDQVVAIREAKDASPAELGITLCNAGIMAFSGRNGLSLLDEIDNKNVQKEFYLT